MIDEIYRVLRYVNSTRAPQRAHEVLQELRDISSMAMEYFDEKIVPILKRKLPGSDVSGRLMGSPPGIFLVFFSFADRVSLCICTPSWQPTLYSLCWPLVLETRLYTTAQQLPLACVSVFFLFWFGVFLFVCFCLFCLNYAL